MTPAIPDRWADYKPIGKEIKGTRFIAFKVPLKEHISKNVDDKIRLDTRILLRKIPNLGLIIDLTNTMRYYNPIDFEREGVQYNKLMVKGREIPSKNIVNSFIKTVKQFMENNKDNDKLIGVHCTHGVNRTGYLICSYMISQMTIKPNEALHRFAIARGYGIERSNYIDNLRKLRASNDGSSSTDLNIDNWRSREEPDNWQQRDTENDYKHSSSSSSTRINTPFGGYPRPGSAGVESIEESDNWGQRDTENGYQHSSSSSSKYTRINTPYGENSRQGPAGVESYSYSSRSRYSLINIPYGGYSRQQRDNVESFSYSHGISHYSCPYGRPSNKRIKRPQNPEPPVVPHKEQSSICNPPHSMGT